VNSSVYQIRGCKGSQKAVEIEWGLNALDAKRRATALNKANADGLGLSYRAYRNRSFGDEGWHYSGRSGKGCAL
jgi:hypothetical protein